jgi:hypothetical protein
MTAMTFVLKFQDTFIEGVQIVFQILNFVLDRKSPGRKFNSGWLLL